MLNFSQSLVKTLKNSPKAMGVFGLLALTGMAHADPIDGYWIYYYNQKPAYVVDVRTSASGVNAVIAAGSKRHNGATVLQGVMPQGNGKYSGGKAFNPLNGSSYDVDLTLNGDVLTMRAYKGFSAFGTTQTLKRLPKGYTFTSGSQAKK